MKLTKAQESAYRSQLTTEARDLTGLVDSLAKEDSSWALMSVSDERSKDSLEGDTITVERSLLAHLSASSSAGAQEVRRALEKLDDGTYGVCDDCGGAIAAPRLEARPRSVRCLSCA